jgi:DHA2 family multidrug resistance protein
MAMLVRGSQTHQNTLAGDVGLGSPVAGTLARGLQSKLFLQGTDMVTAQHRALGALYRSVQQQAALLAYADNFRLIALLALSCIPLLFLLQKVKRQS